MKVAVACSWCKQTYACKPKGKIDGKFCVDCRQECDLPIDAPTLMDLCDDCFEKLSDENAKEDAQDKLLEEVES